MKILGVSGSPIPNSNTDRALRLVLESTGLNTEFVKLIDCTVAPCRGCLECVQTNRCTINDDGRTLAELAKYADALVIAGFTPYSSLDARTKAFIERLYPLRHKQGYMAGKPGAAIITCCIQEGDKVLPPAWQMGVKAIEYYMMEEGMNFVGAMRVQGNVPCIRCGFGDACNVSGIRMLYGPDATVQSVGVSRLEDHPEELSAARALGRKIAQALAAGSR